MKRWLADTLFKRLFLLMWCALVVSHFVAFSVVSLVQRGNVGFLNHVPTLPSLPPTGLEGGRRGGGPSPDFGPRGELDHVFQPPPHDGPPPDDGGPGRGPRDGMGGRPGLPTRILVLDYAIRLFIIGLAAWLGARWLSQPMRKLVAASQSLGGSLGAQQEPTPLDEVHGTVEVREAARVFNSLAQRLRAFLSARSLMVAAISHDLRTPMTRIRMRLEQSADDPLSERSIADIAEMDELIDSALVVFRGQESAEPLQATDVYALVQSLTDDLVELGQPVTLADGEAAVARVQPMALKRVLHNLIGNAMRYGERAEITVTHDERAITIHIDDHGPGIPESQIEAVMQPFFRLDPSRRRSTGGSGLGLYIARDLLERQGGSLTLANRSGGGLRATVVLPRQ